MAKGHGKDSYFALEDVVGTTLRAIGDFCDSIEFERSVDMADSTTIGMEAKEFLPGLEGATITLAGKWDDTATTGPDVVLSGNVGAETSVTWHYGPRGNVAGRVRYSGECFVNRYQVSSPLEGVVKFSAGLTINGAPVRDVFP